MIAEVILKKGEGRTIKAGGAWVYDNEIDRIDGDFENGDIVSVKDFDGYDMGYGFINTASRLTHFWVSQFFTWALSLTVFG